MNFSFFHFHLYFNAHQMELANALASKIADEFQLPIGRVWDRPVGPHPINSCQITVPKEKFESLASWLLVHRQGLDVFIHPEGDDDLADHRDHIMWIGRSYDLKLEIFKESL